MTVIALENHAVSHTRQVLYFQYARKSLWYLGEISLMHPSTACDLRSLVPHKKECACVCQAKHYLLQDVLLCCRFALGLRFAAKSHPHFQGCSGKGRRKPQEKQCKSLPSIVVAGANHYTCATLAFFTLLHPRRQPSPQGPAKKRLAGQSA
ncbi:hypothetical protein [Desulfovibrio sp. An276]|uniref:hypothetical protein n=1 Tax=Desulfovibrio sp. An276 TaxID=1965618 RepID=UPI0013A6541D|nr:hypothetical protein [Desulfovibrio sp. An276]